MKLKILFFLCLLVAGTYTFAQNSLSGTITGNPGRQVLEGVNISISAIKRNVTTDENGYYSIKNIPSGRLLVLVSYTGYARLADTVVITGKTAHNFVLEPSTSKLNEVTITQTRKSGYRSESAAVGPLDNVSLKDIPYSVNVTSGELIENRNAHTPAEALQTNPTATLLMAPNTYSSLSRMMVRGFNAADQNELRDGLTDRSFTLPPVENIDRIEVTNGLSAFLYGFTQAGGVVNYISKQPTPSPMANISIGSYGGGIKFAHADLGGPIDTGGRLGYRFNIYREDGNTYIHSGKQARTLLSGVIDYKILPGTHLKADIYQQDYDVKGLQTYFLLPSGSTIIPSAFDPGKQYGQPWTYNESTKTLMGLSLDSKLNDVFHLRAAYRYGTMWRKYSYVANALLDNNGTYKETYWDSPRQYEKTNSEYVLMDAVFHTGPLFHHLTFGYTGTGYSYQRGVDVNQVLGNSRIDSIASYDIPKYAAGLTTNQTQTFTNFMISDRIELSGAWSALLGLNQARLHQTAGGIYTGISTSNFTQSKLTPSIGLLYKPSGNITAYTSYMQGLTAGGTSPATAANANEILNPAISNQFEAGIKATFGMIDLTAAAFRINQINEFLNPADNIYKQDGREVHKGIEVTATGKLTNRLTLTGGFTLMNARVKKAATAALDNKIPLNVPEKLGRIYLEYALPGTDGLTVSAGENYNGKRPVNTANTAFLPGAATTDAGLRYQPGFWKRRVSLSANVTNLFNKYYWINYRNGDGLQLATPRIFSLAIKAGI